MDFDIVVNIESWPHAGDKPAHSLRLVTSVINGTMISWKLTDGGVDTVLASSTDSASRGLRLVVKRNFEFQIPLSLLAFSQSDEKRTASLPLQDSISRIRVRFSLFQNALPIDALPVEGWIDLHLLSEPELMALA